MNRIIVGQRREPELGREMPAEKKHSAARDRSIVRRQKGEAEPQWIEQWWKQMNRYRGSMHNKTEER